MFELKPISMKSIPSVLEKAERYRLLNEPIEAECICLDVLNIDPENRKALVTLILALTEQIERRPQKKAKEARELLSRLGDPYSEAYFGGIIWERMAKASLKKGAPGSGHVAYGWFCKAMKLFEEAAELREEGNDDALLRWNTCARLIDRNPGLVSDDRSVEDMLE